jgi:hypothetical protein
MTRGKPIRNVRRVRLDEEKEAHRLREAVRGAVATALASQHRATVVRQLSNVDPRVDAGDLMRLFGKPSSAQK